MKIAYIVGSFPHVSETFLVHQIVGIAARGHAVDIFTTCEGEIAEVPAGVRHYGLLDRTHRIFGPRNFVVRLGVLLALGLTCGWRAPHVALRALATARRDGVAAALWLLFAALQLIRLRATNYDVIHAQFGTYGPIALRLVECGAVNGAIVTSFRGFDATKNLQADIGAYRELFRKGALFLPVSRTLGRRLVAAGCDPARVQVHHSGIDCKHIQHAERRRAAESCTRIITIARLVEKKGIRYALEAIARVIASGRKVDYAIVGDGPLRGELERIVEDLGVSEHVSLNGWRPHTEALRMLQTAHILVAPSVTAADGDEEGIPNTVKEAMASGLPVIATRHGGIPELVDDGVSGWLVSERDTGALAERITYLIDHPDRWAAMGQNARRRIEAEFDIDKLNDELVRLYAGITRTREQAVSEGSISPCSTVEKN